MDECGGSAEVIIIEDRKINIKARRELIT